MARSTSLARSLRSVLAVCSFAALAAACGGFSDDEAVARCEQEEDARGAGGCFTDVTFDECVAAYTDCGDDVVVAESCPVQYACGE